MGIHSKIIVCTTLDADGKVVRKDSFENSFDSAKVEKELLKSVKDRIRRIFAGRGYDSNAIYNSFRENTVIPPRRNASTKSRGSPARARIVRQIRRMSEKEWKESVDYGKRWYVEIYFSGLKRTMDEVTTIKRRRYLKQFLTT